MYTNRKIHICSYFDQWGRESQGSVSEGASQSEIPQLQNALQQIPNKIQPLIQKQNTLEGLIQKDIPYMQSNLDANFGSAVLTYTEQRSQAINDYNSAKDEFGRARQAESAIQNELSNNKTSLQNQMQSILDDDPDADAKSRHNQEIIKAIQVLEAQAQERIREQQGIQKMKVDIMQQIGGANPNARDNTQIGQLNHGFDLTQQQYKQTKESNEKWLELKRQELGSVKNDINALEQQKTTLLGRIRALGWKISEYASPSFQQVSSKVKSAVQSIVNPVSSKNSIDQQAGDAAGIIESQKKKTYEDYMTSVPPPTPEQASEMRMKLWGRSDVPAPDKNPTPSVNPVVNNESKEESPGTHSDKESPKSPLDQAPQNDPDVSVLETGDQGVKGEYQSDGVRRVIRAVDKRIPSTPQEKEEIRSMREEVGSRKVEADKNVENLGEKFNTLLQEQGLSEKQFYKLFHEYKKSIQPSQEKQPDSKVEDGTQQPNQLEENADLGDITPEDFAGMASWLEERVIAQGVNIKDVSPDREKTLKKVMAYVQLRSENEGKGMKLWTEISDSDIANIQISDLQTFFADEDHRGNLFADNEVVAAFLPPELQKTDPILSQFKNIAGIGDISNTLRGIKEGVEEQSAVEKEVNWMDQQYAETLQQSPSQKALDPDAFLQQQGYQLSRQTNTYVPSQIASHNLTSANISRLNIGDSQTIASITDVGVPMNVELIKLNTHTYSVQVHGRKFVFESGDETSAKKQIDMYLELAGTPIVDSLMRSKDEVFQKYLQNKQGKLVFQMESGDQKELNPANKNIFLDYFFHSYLGASGINPEYGGVSLSRSGFDIKQSFAENIAFREPLLAALRQKNLLMPNNTLRIPEEQRLDQKKANEALSNWPG